jgi:hypothetical protein
MSERTNVIKSKGDTHNSVISSAETIRAFRRVNNNEMITVGPAIFMSESESVHNLVSCMSRIFEIFSKRYLNNTVLFWVCHSPWESSFRLEHELHVTRVGLHNFQLHSRFVYDLYTFLYHHLIIRWCLLVYLNPQSRVIKSCCHL